MPKTKLKIAHFASEVEPYSKSGGLASITASLPKMQKELGYEVLVVTPFYEGIVSKNGNHLEELDSGKLEIEGVKYKISYFKGYLASGLPVYFIANKKFFGKRDLIYGAKNENARFFFFNLAALNLLKKIKWQPDIVHCHDWQAGLIPYFLKGRFKNDSFWKNTAILYTIHNLAYQLGHDWWKVPIKKRDDGRSRLPSFHDRKNIETINFAKRAILSADAINAVSETYREEIMTKSFGEELHRILRNREKRVFGIVNGINYEEYNPATDPGLHQNYNFETHEKKRFNKKWLQKKFRLKVDAEIPLICMTSRIVEQKGFGILLEVLPSIFRQEIQFIIMGDGDDFIKNELGKIKKKYPKKFNVTKFNSKYETSIYAGSDIFLLPSRFEPCGINQMIALRYGVIPIVHRIGGLADTITNFNPIKRIGNGFTFQEYESLSLAMALTRALETYKYKEIWNTLVKSVMLEANSWKIPAQKYIDLYKKTISFKKKNGK